MDIERRNQTYFFVCDHNGRDLYLLGVNTLILLFSNAAAGTIRFVCCTQSFGLNLLNDGICCKGT